MSLPDLLTALHARVEVPPTWTPKRLHCGGQTGADAGAFRAALDLGILPGGWIPKGCVTEAGPAPGLLRYGFRECEIPGYPPRTERNVRECDGAIVFRALEATPGTTSTIRLLVAAKKPHFILPWYDANCPVLGPGFREDVRRWLAEHRPETLLVAGPRESLAPGCQEGVRGFLRGVWTP